MLTVLSYSDHMNLFEAWNEIGIETIQRNANEIWETRDWTSSANSYVLDFSQACGEVENGVCGRLNDSRMGAFLKR